MAAAAVDCGCGHLMSLSWLDLRELLVLRTLYQ